MAAYGESDNRRHHRSSTYGQLAWDLPAERREPGRHLRRLSQAIDKLSPRGSGYTEIPEHSDHSIRYRRPVVDEPSVRGIIEQRMEQRAGITQSTSVYDPVVIHTQDLREQCRQAAREKQQAEKGLFSKSSSAKKLIASAKNKLKIRREVTPPPMPIKAAEVLGTTPRTIRKYLPRPIKPSHVIEPRTESPTKRSPSHYTVARSHHAGVGRRDHKFARRSSPGSRGPRVRGKSIAAETRTAGKRPSSPTPPPPPAKDTPPRQEQAARQTSPLRHMSPSRDLRGSFESSRELARKPFKVPTHFAIPKSVRQLEAEAEAAEDDGVPIKQGTYDSQDMTALLEGRARAWPSTADAQAHNWSEDESEHVLLPRFYSPANHSARSFAPGESASTNTDPSRMLFRHAPKADRPNSSDASSGSKDGYIGVMFQGSPDDIDRGSSTAKMLSERDKTPTATATATATRDDTAITTRVMQELRLSDHRQPGTASSRPAFDPPSSRLTEMLHDADPRLHGWERFQPNCPSAVPSPLHQMAGPLTPGHSAKASPSQVGSLNSRTPRNMDEHFWMTNEHLDVVGKTTWDILAMSNQETLTAIGAKHAKLVALIEKHFDDLQSHLTTVNEKADRSAEKITNVHHDVNKLLSLYKTEIAGAFAANDKKTAQMEGQLKELQAGMQAMQKLLEQKSNESKSSQQQSTNNPLNTPNSVHSPYAQPIHRSQPSLAGYYGHHANAATREGQPQMPPMPPMPDDMNAASPQDSSNAAQTGYDTGYGQQWGSRTGYPVRGSSREVCPPYSGTNPYQFATGGPFSGGYPGGYSHNFPSSPSEPPFGFGPGQTK